MTGKTRQRIDYILRIAVLAVTYVIVSRLGIVGSTSAGNVVILWAPAGFYVGVLLQWGYQYWPSVLIGSAAFTLLGSVPLSAALAIALASTFEALFAAYLLRAVGGFDNALNRIRDVIVLLVYGVVVAPATAAALGIIGLCLVGATRWANFPTQWWNWLMGAAVSILVFTPLVLVTVAGWNRWRRSRRLAEFAILCLALVIVCQCAFGGWLNGLLYGSDTYLLTYLVFPVVIWAALRFGVAGSAWTVALAVLLASGDTVAGNGPFARTSLQESLSLLHFFSITITASAFLLAASIAERRQAEAARDKNEKRNQDLLQAVRRQAQELSLLNEARTALAQETDLSDVFRKVVEAIANIFGYTQVSIYRREGDYSYLQHQVGYDQVIERVPINAGVSGRVIRSGKPLLVEDVGSDPDFLQAIHGLVSEVCVPLFDHEQVVGFLNVETSNGVKLTEADLHLMEALSDHIGFAIVRARLYTELRESEMRYRGVVEDQTEMICRFLPDGTLTFVNQAFTRYQGKPREDIIGKDLRSFLPQLVYWNFKTRLDSLTVENPVGTWDQFTINPQGEPCWQQWTDRAIFNRQDQLIEYQSVGRDITTRVMAVSELRRLNAVLEQRVQERTEELNRQQVILQTVLNSLGEGVVYTSNRSIRYMNNALAEMTGYSISDWTANFSEMEKDYANLGQALGAYFARRVVHGATWRGEMPIAHKDGSSFDAAVAVTAIREGAMVTGSVTIVRDITNEKRLQEQKTRFIANASHELRTPLTNIKTRIYLLRKQPEQLLVHLAALDKAADQMTSLVEDLLDVTQFERGRIPLDRRDVVLQDLINDVIVAQQPEAARKDINIVPEVSGAALHVMADPKRMLQVITNLLVNAINYTPESGRITVQLDSESGSGGSKWAVMKICDTGIGIAPDLVGRVFEPFFRANEGQGRGTGLGLSISKEIVDLHNGLISVESTPGVGSTFILKLPTDGSAHEPLGE